MSDGDIDAMLQQTMLQWKYAQQRGDLTVDGSHNALLQNLLSGAAGMRNAYVDAPLTAQPVPRCRLPECESPQASAEGYCANHQRNLESWRAR